MSATSKELSAILETIEDKFFGACGELLEPTTAERVTARAWRVAALTTAIPELRNIIKHRKDTEEAPDPTAYEQLPVTSGPGLIQEFVEEGFEH